MDKVHDLGHERLLGTSSMAWCIPFESTTCGHWGMGTLEEAHPNLVLLVRIVLHNHYLIGSNAAPGIPIHQIVNRPPTRHDPCQYRELKRQAPKMGVHIPECLLPPANRVGYRPVSLLCFASTPTMSEVETRISRPHNRTLLRPQPKVHSSM